MENADNMGRMFKFPKREEKTVEDLYRREFGYVICKHKKYLPNEYCQACDDAASKELQKILGCFSMIGEVKRELT